MVKAKLVIDMVDTNDRPLFSKGETGNIVRSEQEIGETGLTLIDVGDKGKHWFSPHQFEVVV